MVLQIRTIAKKKCREEPGELCQLNLDILFLVRSFTWLSFRKFADGRHDVDATSWPHTFVP